MESFRDLIPADALTNQIMNKKDLSANFLAASGHLTN